MTKKDEIRNEIVSKIESNGLGTFALDVEKIVKLNGCGYLTAIIEWCDEKGVDPEEVKPLIKGPLLNRIRESAMRLNLMKDKPTTNTLF